MNNEPVAWTACLDCGKRVADNSIHTCSPQLKTLTDEEINNYLEVVNIDTMTRMEREFWEWVEENVTPWPYPKKILINYWIVWQASWHKSSEKVEVDDGRC